MVGVPILDELDRAGRHGIPERLLNLFRAINHRPIRLRGQAGSFSDREFWRQCA